MLDLDFPELSAQMADLASRGREQASRPQVSRRERHLLRVQIRAAERSSEIFARCAAAEDERELVRLLKHAQGLQKRIVVCADRLLAPAGGV